MTLLTSGLPSGLASSWGPGALRALAVLSLMVLAACGARDPVTAPLPPAVETAAAASDVGAGGLTVSGTLERQREMNLSFRVGGVMTALSVDVGDAVAAGQVLARALAASSAMPARALHGAATPADGPALGPEAAAAA